MNEPISVVIPVRDEAATLAQLFQETKEALSVMRVSFEILFVNDGSIDLTRTTLEELTKSEDCISALHLPLSRGQSEAVRLGIEKAKNDLLVTLDGDLQNDPSDIPQLLSHFFEGVDFVQGRRTARQDATLPRKLPSFWGNFAVRALTGTDLRDVGCALRVFRRSQFAKVPLIPNFHRCLGVCFHLAGMRVVEIPVSHRARIAGRSHYGLERYGEFLISLIRLYRMRQKAPSLKRRASK